MKVLVIPASSEQIFPPSMVRRWADVLRAQGNSVDAFEIEGDGGHYDGLFQVSRASTAIHNFLQR